MKCIHTKSLALAAISAILLGAGCAADGGSKNTSAENEKVSRVMPECQPGETLMCQTGKTGFGRLSTGRNTNYDYCSCEPDSVVIQDRPLPQY